ncbi:hypothetical protein [Brevibacillus laterosporus]
MKKKRSTALHIQLPPASSMERFNTKVKAKKKEDIITKIDHSDRWIDR